MTSDFEEYVAARQRALVGFAYLLTADHHAAEDLVQTALAKAYVRWAKIRERGSAEAYVRKIIVNENASMWRRAWRRKERTTDEPPDRGIDDADPTGHGEMWGYVKQLPPRQRAVLVLRFYEDLTEAQTAESLGCSIGTVKSQTSKALASLRQRVTPATGIGDVS